MNDILDVIKDRRTIRKYTDEPIREEHRAALFSAMERAQSWNNSQCWEVVEIRDPELRNQIQKTVPPRNPAFKAIVDAPMLLAVCARKGCSGTLGDDVMVTKHGDWYMYDLGIATQNLCLAAHSLGLGTVVVGWFDIEGAEKVIKVPQGVELVSLIPVGYRNQKGVTPKHKPANEFVHIDTF